MPYAAMICGSCSYEYKDKCAKCGAWIPNGGPPAMLCNSCSYEHRDKCIKCGTWCP